jgi:hypothetical protein
MGVCMAVALINWSFWVGFWDPIRSAMCDNNCSCELHGIYRIDDMTLANLSRLEQKVAEQSVQPLIKVVDGHEWFTLGSMVDANAQIEKVTKEIMKQWADYKLHGVSVFVDFEPGHVPILSVKEYFARQNITLVPDYISIGPSCTRDNDKRDCKPEGCLRYQVELPEFD